MPKSLLCLCLAFLLVGLVRSEPALAQTPNAPSESPPFATMPPAVPLVDKGVQSVQPIDEMGPVNRCNRIRLEIRERSFGILLRIKKNRSVSDEDLAYIIEESNRGDLSRLEQSHLIFSLHWLKKKNVTPAQDERIFSLLVMLMQKDDREIDPSGSIKTTCLHIILLGVSDKKYAPYVKALTKDERKNVSEWASHVLRRRGWRVQE